jgi:hypothetical protein
MVTEPFDAVPALVGWSAQLVDDVVSHGRCPGARGRGICGR